MMHDPSTYIVIEKNPKAILLCGHIHSLFKHLLPEKRIINVGVDAWDMKPVSFDQILELLNSYNIL
jgi:calcineurin-like phosphoesterase family protein